MTLTRTTALCCLLLVGIPAFGQSLPERPKPVIDKEFKIQMATLGASYALDMTSTKHWIDNCPGCWETGWFGHHTRSMPKISAGGVAFDAGMVLLAYEWKKHVRNKWLHQLWRVPMLYQATIHTREAVGNYRKY